jgi:NitT/TauT family transport system ATP-binding protein/nitrate/nitrite transport system substrate-binding protein
MTSSAPFRIGLLRLTDAAPLIAAHELGYFAAEDIDVSLSVEPSWANVADKLAYGLLDGAMMLPPLALALELGLSGSGGPEAIVVPAALSLNGNTVTLAEHWAGPVLGDQDAMPAIETARRFGALIRARRERPVLAVVHTFATHNLLMRYWLAAGGIDPAREVAFTVVPPAETADALAAGQIDGFCAGAPWGEVAARAGSGRAVTVSSAIWTNGVEKVFAVRRRTAAGEPTRLRRVLRALLRAAIYCDDQANSLEVARVLASPRYLGLPAEVIATSLPGAAERRAAGGVTNADVSVFHANAATFPWRSQAIWFLRQMRRWGYLGPGNDEAAAGIFRPDLYADAARSLGVDVPVSTAKSEGRHAASWSLAAAPQPIAMGCDRFMDGATFAADDPD